MHSWVTHLPGGVRATSADDQPHAAESPHPAEPRRLLEESSYWAEVAAAAHPAHLRLCFVGPEVSAAAPADDQSGRPRPAPTLGSWSSLCFRGTCGEFLRQPRGTPAGEAAAAVRLVIGARAASAALHGRAPRRD